MARPVLDQRSTIKSFVASRMYREHLLSWSVDHDARSEQWRPLAIIAWKEGGSVQFHKMTGSLLISRQEAFAMASLFGKAWVDEKL
jgi:hypothetical protein